MELGLPRDISTEGWRIDRLIEFTLVAVGILFLIMVIWMLWAVIKHGRTHKAHYDHGESKKAVMAKLGVAGMIFLGVDGTLFVNSTHDVEEVFWNFSKTDSLPGVIKIEVNAHQWAWDFRYPGPDGVHGTEDDPLELNDLRVPVDTPISFQLAATDVLHSFYIPNLRVKQDVVPGSITRAWFQAKETGEFDIACAQHCGVNHYLMRGRLIVMPKAEYEEWAAWASNVSKRTYDEANKDQNWAWKWRDK